MLRVVCFLSFCGFLFIRLIHHEFKWVKVNEFKCVKVNVSSNAQDDSFRKRGRECGFQCVLLFIHLPLELWLTDDVSLLVDRSPAPNRSPKPVHAHSLHHPALKSSQYFCFWQFLPLSVLSVCVHRFLSVCKSSGSRTDAAMAELEGLEFGKSDFVLLDEVTMEQFMENLKLR